MFPQETEGHGNLFLSDLLKPKRRQELLNYTLRNRGIKILLDDNFQNILSEIRDVPRQVGAG